MLSRVRSTFRYVLLVLIVLRLVSSMTEGITKDEEFIEEIIFRTIADRHLEVITKFEVRC
jgi:hypothetical protein